MSTRGPRLPGRAYPYDRGSLSEEDVRRIARAEARALLTSVDARNVYPPRSIPLRTVDPVPLVTALPLGAVDGDEVYFLADADGGVIWHLRYRPGSSYPWEFIGGSSVRDYVSDQETTASTSYTDLATVGPTVTAPLAGDYKVELGADFFNNATTYSLMSFEVGGTAASDTDSVLCSADHETTCSRYVSKADIPAGAELTAKYRVSGGTGQWSKRSIAITPIRVA